eukprot:UN04998
MEYKQIINRTVISYQSYEGCSYLQCYFYSLDVFY